MARSKYTLEEVRSLFINVGYTPLFSEYKNNRQSLEFRCDKGHEHFICLRDFNSGKRCGLCANTRKITLEEAQATFSKEGYTPLFDKYTTSHKPVPFRCPQGHHHKISLSSFKKGSRCLICSRDSRKLSLKEAQEEFTQVGYTPHFTKYVVSTEKVPYTCDRGHRGDITLNSFRAGHRCPVCAREDRRTGIQEARESFLSRGYTPLFSDIKSQMEPLPFVCDVGHEHDIRLHNLKRGQRCGVCQHLGSSRAEEEIKDHFTSISIPFLANTRKVIPPYELDLFFPAQKLAVEYCGLYWHAEVSGEKSRDYHYKKRALCEDLGIRLITVFEDEYLNYPQVVFSRIENALGISKHKVYARKCQVINLDSKTAFLFLKENHLQASSRGNLYLGLTYKDKLIGVMVGGHLSRNHVAKNKTLELKRLCFLPDYSVVGGPSKLFSRLVKFARDNKFTAVRSYQDMRYGDPFNPVYERLGFKLIAETKYTPHYLTGWHKVRIRNQALRKTPEERLTGKTEWELRREQGYDRIWDCGHRTYELVL